MVSVAVMHALLLLGTKLLYAVMHSDCCCHTCATLLIGPGPFSCFQSVYQATCTLLSCLQTQLRAKSAAAAAKKSFHKLTKSSSSADSLQDTPVPAENGRRSPDAASLAGDHAGQASTEQHSSTGPWRTPAVSGASVDAASRAAASTAGKSEQRSRANEHGSPAARAQSHTGAPYLVEQGSAGLSAGAAGSSSWLSYSGWKVLSSWIWPEAGPAQEAAAAEALRAASPQPSVRPPSSSPWPVGGGGEDSGEEQEDSYDDSHSSLSSLAGGDGRGGTSPLALLSHVVHMQKELEQQRVQLEVMQQQLDRTSNRCVFL